MKYHQELYIATRSLGPSGSRLLSPALQRLADKIQNNSGKPKVVRKYLCQVVRNTVRSLGGIQLTMFEKYTKRRNASDFCDTLTWRVEGIANSNSWMLFYSMDEIGYHPVCKY